jgi:hypothetical protein
MDTNESHFTCDAFPEKESGASCDDCAVNSVEASCRPDLFAANTAACAPGRPSAHSAEHAPALAPAHSTDRDTADYPGYERLMECGEEWLTAGDGSPLVTEGALEFPVSMVTSFRDEAALFYDYNLRRLSQVEAMVELGLGKGLNGIKNRLMELGYARMKDFAAETLGISHRLASELMRNASALDRLPSLCAAYCAAMVKRSALRSLLRVITADNEEALVEKASAMTVREIEEHVESLLFPAAGSEALVGGGGEDDCREVRLWERGDLPDLEEHTFIFPVKVPLATAARFDFALELFRRMEEEDLPVSEFIEALCAEFVAFDPSFIAGSGRYSCTDERGFSSPRQEEGCGAASTLHHEEEDSAPYPVRHEEEGSAPYAVHLEDKNSDYSTSAPLGDAIVAFEERASGALRRAQQEEAYREEIGRHFREIRKACEEESNHWDFLPSYPLFVELPESLAFPDGIASQEILSRLQRLARLRNTIALHQGTMLRNLSNHRLDRLMLFSSPGHYVKERLGMARSTAYRRISLDRTIRNFSELAEKLASGELSMLKVETLGRIFSEGTYHKAEWIAFAGASTVRELQEEAQRYFRVAEAHPQDRWRYAPGFARTGFSLCANHDDPPQSAREGPMVTLLIPVYESLIPLYQKALSLYCAQCLFNGREPAPGHFLDMMVTHFLEVHAGKRRVAQRQRILERDGYRCKVPGCSSRRSLQIHHITYRSRGGSDDDCNLVTLCLAHHLRGVHEGHIIIEGEASRIRVTMTAASASLKTLAADSTMASATVSTAASTMVSRTPPATASRPAA